MKNKIKAEVVADSLNPQGDRLTSLLITFPRIILAEVNTHRMLSKNTSSSRAIPFKKMVEAVEKDPFIPIAWQKGHKGMQGSEYWTTDTDIDEFELEWLQARNKAVFRARNLNDAGVTKQICNRLLEPWMWTTMLITGSKEGWDNFFKLRCPVYEQWYYNDDGSQDFEIRRSRKEYISKSGYPNSVFFVRPDKSRVAMLEATDLDWLQRNKGQAEIHIQALAEAIYDAMNESTPKKLNEGEWHIPFRDKINLTPEFVHSIYPNIEDKEQENEYYNSLAIKISTSMAARTSYTTIGDEKEVSLEKHIQLFDKLIKQDPPHSSPFEHCAKCMSDHIYYSFVKGEVPTISDEEGILNLEYCAFSNGRINPFDKEDSSFFMGFKGVNPNNGNRYGWCNNFKGFTQFRYMMESFYKM